MASKSKAVRELHKTWATMPFAAMNRIEGNQRRRRVKAMQAMTAVLSLDAFADEADTSNENVGTYYTKETILGVGGLQTYEQGEDKK